jgi:peptidoglycan/xylan/chitin deacetylase (PgdA/CDA1 family)
VKAASILLKKAKILFLQTSERLGLSRLALNSNWRRDHLLILCYHGISLEDEHEWDSNLYITRELLRERMQTLADEKCNVLPLDEAVRRLYAGNLPERSAVITFDDGTYDFYRVAWPILREYKYPVTVYLTTYYSEFNRPVFDVMASYLLWKAASVGHLDWPEALPSPIALDENGRNAALRAIRNFTLERKLSGREKDELLSRLAVKLGIDYEALCRKRLLHIMTPAEARQLASEGVDIQLHTHRHRVWRRREKFFSELDDNRKRIADISPVEPRHFCYTGGFYLPEFSGYLEEYGIRSATTCELGLCSRKSNPMQLPRLVDTSGVSGVEFRGWVSGVADLLPRRPYVMSEGQLAEEG